MTGREKQSNQEVITIPISGMNCAACSARVEKGLHSLPGVSAANVNLVMGKGMINYNPEEVGPRQIVERIIELGFGVTAERQEFSITGMSCAACSARVENRLNGLPGIKGVAVNLATGKASVQYIPGLIGPREIVEAVNKLGFKARPARDLTFEETVEARRKEINWQLARFIVALLLTFPLFVMMIAHHIGLHFELNPYWQLILATPVQFLPVGLYRGAYRSLKAGSANMDVLVALGTSVAYFYSLVSLIAGWGLFTLSRRRS